MAGCAMFLLVITGLVQKSMAYVPGHIKLCTIIGIGFLLATIGFESSGIIQNGHRQNHTLTHSSEVPTS